MVRKYTSTQQTLYNTTVIIMILLNIRRSKSTGCLLSFIWGDKHTPVPQKQANTSKVSVVFGGNIHLYFRRKHTLPRCLLSLGEVETLCTFTLSITPRSLCPQFPWIAQVCHYNCLSLSISHSNHFKARCSFMQFYY